MPKFDLTANITARLLNKKSISSAIKSLGNQEISTKVRISNLKGTTDKIKNALKVAPVKIEFNTSSVKNVAQLRSSFAGLNTELKAVVKNIKTVDAIIGSLGQSFGRFGQTSKQVTKTRTEVQKLTTATKESGHAIAEFGKVAGLSLRRNTGFLLATTAVFGFTLAIKNAISEAIAFDKQLVKVAQVSQRSVSSLSSLNREITRLSTSLGVSSADLIDVAQTLAQAGFTATQTREALDALAKTTLSATFGDIQSTTEGAIALMTQFGVQAKELNGALGSVNKVSADFAVESEDIISAIKRTGGVFAQTSKGVVEGTDALEQFIALFTSVRATTRESAESIATGLRTVFVRLERPETIKFFKDLGVQLTDVNGKFVGPFQAIEKLSGAFSKLDTRSLLFARIVEELGGVRQAGKVIPLLTQAEVRIKALKSAQEGQNSVNEDAEQGQQALAVQIKKTREEFVALLRDISQTDTFRAITTSILELTNQLIGFADAVKPILPLIAGLAAVKGFNFGKEFFSKDAFPAGLKGRSNKKFATGGIVRGGRGGIDDIPANLTAGEFVIRKQAVKAIGVSTLKRLNNLGGNLISGGVSTTGRIGFASGGEADIIDAQLANRRKRLELLQSGSGNPQEKSSLEKEIKQLQTKKAILEKQGGSAIVAPITRREETRAKRVNQNRTRRNPAPVTLATTGLDGSSTSQVSNAVVARIKEQAINEVESFSLISKDDRVALSKATTQLTNSLSAQAQQSNKAKDATAQLVRTALTKSKVELITNQTARAIGNSQQNLFDNPPISFGKSTLLDGDEALLNNIANRPRGIQPNKKIDPRRVRKFEQISNTEINNLVDSFGVKKVQGNLFDDDIDFQETSNSNVSRTALRQANKTRSLKARIITSLPSLPSLDTRALSNSSAGRGILTGGRLTGRALSQTGRAATGTGAIFGIGIGGQILASQLEKRGKTEAAAGVSGGTSGALVGAQLGGAIGGGIGGLFGGVGAVPGAAIGAGLGAIGGAISGLVSSIKAARLDEQFKKLEDSFLKISGKAEQAAKNFDGRNVDELLNSFDGLSGKTVEKISSNVTNASIGGVRGVGIFSGDGVTAGSLLNGDNFLNAEGLKARKKALISIGKDTRSDLSGASDAALVATRALIENKGLSSEQAIEKLSPQAKTALAFKFANDGQLEALSLAGNTARGGSTQALNAEAERQLSQGSTAEFLKSLQTSAEAAKNFAKTMEKTSVETDLLVARLDNFSVVLDRISELGEGSRRQNEALLSRRGGGAGIANQQIENVFANSRAFTNKEVQGVIGRISSAGSSGAELGRALGGAKQLETKLPSVLNELNGKLKQLGNGPSSDTLIESAIQKNFGALPSVIQKSLTLQLQSKFGKPGQLDESLANGDVGQFAESFTKNVNEVGRKFVEVFNKNIADYQEVLNTFVSLNKEAAEAYDSRVQIEIEGFNSLKELSGNFLSVADRSRGANVQIGRLGSRAGLSGNFDVNSLIDKEGSLTRKLQGPFSGSADKIAESMTVLSIQQQSAVEALNQIVSNTSEQAALQADLNSIIDARGAARKVLEDFQFGSPTEQRKILRSVDLANQVREGQTLFTQRDRDEARVGQGILNTFAGAQGPEAAFALDQQFLKTTANSIAQELFGAIQDVGFNQGSDLNSFLFRRDDNFQGRLGQLNEVQQIRARAQEGLANINQRDANQFLQNGRNSFDAVQNNLFNPDGLLDRLNATLGQLPEEIKVGGNLAVNLTINGAEALANIQPEVTKLIKKELDKQLNQRLNPFTGETSPA